MLRRPILTKLLNSFESDTVQVVDGVIFIKGFGHFTPADVDACHKICASDAQRKVVRVQIIVPETCECPETYELTVVQLPDYELYETDTTFDVNFLKEYQHPVGGTFTAAQAAAGLVEQINLDKAIPVTAVQTNSSGTADPAGEYITLTSKTDESDYNVYNPAGTVTVVTPFKRARLNAKELSKKFPIQQGHFGARPNLAHCGDYCRYYLKIRKCCATESDSYDISMDRAIQGTEIEVEFYVNTGADDFDQFWGDILELYLPCLQPESSS